MIRALHIFNPDQGTPSVLLRKCAIVGYFPRQLFPNFKSHELLQGFARSEAIFSSPHAPLMARALMPLMKHNIERGNPNLWIHDLRFFALIPEGVKYLNDFPFELLKRLHSALKEGFWNVLYGVWEDHFKGLELVGFSLLLLNLCVTIADLVGFLGFFNNQQLERITSCSPFHLIRFDFVEIIMQSKQKFTELSALSALYWKSMLTQEEITQEWWGRLLGPEGLFHQHARDCVKSTLPTKVTGTSKRKYHPIIYIIIIITF